MHKEEHVYEQLAHYLNLKHPNLIYHFSPDGLYSPSHKARSLYGRINRRAWPDFCLAQPALMPGTTDMYSALFIEIKREGTRLKKKNGEWASEHIAEQAMILKALGSKGYVAVFAVGLDECVDVLESYLEGVPGEAQHRGEEVF